MHTRWSLDKVKHGSDICKNKDRELTGEETKSLSTPERTQKETKTDADPNEESFGGQVLAAWRVYLIVSPTTRTEGIGKSIEESLCTI